MPTTPQGIYYPDAATNITPQHTVLATMASSIDTILADDTQIHRVANTTARAALASSFSPTTAKPLFVWRADADAGRQLEYTKNGSTWYSYRSSEDDTGWLDVTLFAGYTGGMQVRRIGRSVSWRGTITRSAGNFAVGNNYTVVPTGGTPAGTYSTVSFAHNVMVAVNVVGLVSYFNVGIDGSVTMRVAVAGNEFRPVGGYMLP